MKLMSQMPSSTSSNTEFLTGEHGRDIDLFPMHADTAAGGDEDGTVVGIRVLVAPGSSVVRRYRARPGIAWRAPRAGVRLGKLR